MIVQFISSRSGLKTLGHLNFTPAWSQASSQYALPSHVKGLVMITFIITTMSLSAVCPEKIVNGLMFRVSPERLEEQGFEPGTL